MPTRYTQLVSYIALGAPGTRRPATGTEPYLRPEFGFTPRWYQVRTGVDFGERWHEDLSYRRDALTAMADTVRRSFYDVNIGWAGDLGPPPDLLSGLFGLTNVAAIYGLPIQYFPDNWPTLAHEYLSEAECDRLEPPDLTVNPHMRKILAQVDQIGELNGRVEGYINWQGVLNNAFRLRGQDLFVDMVVNPERATRIFGCMAQTMVDGMSLLYARQRETGFDVQHVTVSNCLMNLVSASQYRELLLPFDTQVSKAFRLTGVHTCAWTADPYLDALATIKDIAYIDMGRESDLRRARGLFPQARRAIMYTPMDFASFSEAELAVDFERIAEEYGPCDLVLADIDAHVPDERVLYGAELCRRISQDRG